MTDTTTYDEGLRRLQGEVTVALRERGVDAEGWLDSAGSAVHIRLPSGNSLLANLDSDGGAEAWTRWDLSDPEGELIASGDVQVRPYGVKPLYGEVDSHLKIAEAFVRLVNALR